MAKKKTAVAVKVSDESWAQLEAGIKQFNLERSPHYWVERLESAAREILSKYTATVGVLPIRRDGSLTEEKRSSADVPWELPKKWPAGTKPKDIARAQAARELMRELHDLKRLLADKSEAAREVTIACAVTVGIKAEAMALGHVVIAAQASKEAMSNGKAEAYQKRLKEFSALYTKAKAETPNRTDKTYFQKVNAARVAAGLETFSDSAMNEYKLALGLSNRRKQ